MSKHTPGPWTVWVGHTDVYAYNYGGENKPWVIDGICVASCDPDNLYSDDETAEEKAEIEAKANARLIAAAPVLLEVCRRAKKLLEPEVTKEPHRTIFWELVEAIKLAGDKL